ncbi:MAG: twin-arginine translocase TatA/TatE family subunit [Treponema sp.]|jgi:sec-independent protein translocase protein TatB|nr:twin-arginine translocase TatA/TatE family subunit [Treponema sp.]
MFNIGMGELLVILVAAMVLVGPGDLPKVTHWLARAFKSIRTTVKSITTELNLDEDIREVKKAGRELKETVHNINPLAEVTDEIEKTKRETREAFTILDDLNKNISEESEKTPVKNDDLKKDTREV